MADHHVTEWVKSENVNQKSITKSQLQEYLRNRDLPTTGTKQQLIDRARGAQKLGFDDLIEQKAQDAVRETDRDRRRLLTVLGENLPDPTCLTGWISDCVSFPTFTEKELYNFLVLNRNTFDHEAVSAKKQLGKAQVFYDDGQFQHVQFHHVSDRSSHSFIRCQCLPSFPGSSATKKPSYNCWICLSKVTSHVHSAKCDCVAGQGEACNHIAALMIALTDISKKQSEGKLTPTSLACSWIKPIQRAMSPKKSTEIMFAGRSCSGGTKQECVSQSLESNASRVNGLEKYEEFRSKLEKVNPGAAWLKNFKCESNIDQPSEADNGIPALHNVDRMFTDVTDLHGKECTDYFKAYEQNLKLTSEDCVKLFDVTLGQSRNDMWFESRFGRLTSSRFGTIARRKSTTQPDSLLKLLLGYTVPYQGKEVRHGLQYEQRARDSYALITRELHPSLKVKECGLCVNPACSYLGASPDGFCTCKHCENSDGLVEIKCPFKFKNCTPCEAAKSDNFCCKLQKDDTLQLKRTHSYYYQVQGQMGVTGRKWCDFVIWTFKGVSVERIHFDAEFWQNLLIKLNAFFVECMLPELFSEHVKRRIPLFP